MGSTAYLNNNLLLSLAFARQKCLCEQGILGVSKHKCTVQKNIPYKPYYEPSNSVI